MSKRYSDLKTPLWTRITIAIIGIVLVGGTIVGFIVAAAQTQNPEIDPTQIAQQKAQNDYEEQLKEAQKQTDKRKKTLRAISGYADKVGSFDAASITSLNVETLKNGDGKTLSSDTTIVADYTGWTPDGTIFDSTTTTKNSDGSGSDTTNSSATFKLDEVIKGWTEGLAGKNVGGVYLLSIPSDLAYGAQGDGSGTIQPDTPLKFLVSVLGAK